MTPQIYLIAPESTDATRDLPAFAKLLQSVLSAAPVSALLLLRGDRDDAAYAGLADAVLPVAQQNGCALLLQNAPDIAKTVGADGVHITTGLADVQAALKSLKPDLIVGTAGNNSHHDAMSAGEAGVDYILFGTLVGAASPKAAEDAAWWSETFEVPAVYANPATPIEDLENTGAEFVGLGDTIFAAENPATALADAAKKLGIE